jgi:hypothetical protein
MAALAAPAMPPANSPAAQTSVADFKALFMAFSPQSKKRADISAPFPDGDRVVAHH